MVKKKSKSKRITLKDKFKIQKRTAETHRKRRKEAKRDAANGVVRVDKKKKDPGIPNSWPFKQELLKDIQRAKEQQQQKQQESKEKRKAELQMLREHQKQGGTARTIQELLDQAQRDQGEFDAKQQLENVHEEVLRSDGTTAAGQQSRRAYLRELKKVVDAADIILQVLDARDPLGSRIHPSVENAILSHADKRMVLVLNKIDLVPKKVVAEWLAYLRRSHPTIAIKANSQFTSAGGSSGVETASLATNSNVPVGMDELLQLLKNYARTGGAGSKSKTTIVAGIIGYPNTGKSSIINALKRTRAVGVSSRPGFTTSMQEVVLDKNVRLLDSPGVVFDDRSAMLGNCVDAVSVEDPIPAVTALLKRCNHASLLMSYNIPSFPCGDVMAFLALVAKSYGRVGKGGVPNKIAAARAVLKDWNHGKIPFYTEPPKTNAQKNVSNDAVIVSSFGKEFDVSKFDETVLNSLKDTDDMDFVKLEDGSTCEKGDGAVTRETVEYFMSEKGEIENNDDDDASDMDEEESADDEKPERSRAHLAALDDYDFDEM